MPANPELLTEFPFGWDLLSLLPISSEEMRNHFPANVRCEGSAPDRSQETVRLYHRNDYTLLRLLIC